MPIPTRRPPTPPRPASDFDLPPPPAFGPMFPAKFTDWRKDQPRAILTTTESNRRFIAQAAPTGFGKSLTYLGVALISELRVCILTSTKGLQEQLLTDFNGDGEKRLVDVRGQNAYRCVVAGEFGYPEYTTVDHAPCHSGTRCHLKSGGCKYYDAVKAASEAKVVITNYAFWLSVNRYTEWGLGKFDLLVLDEAHDAADILAEFMSVELHHDCLVPLGGKLLDPGCDIRQWKEWAGYWQEKVKTKADSLRNTVQLSPTISAGAIKQAKDLKILAGKLQSIIDADDDWVIEKVQAKGARPNDYTMRFDPLWPWKHAESYLFHSIPKVMLVSATLCPKTCKLLGIDDNDLDFQEYDSQFPVSRRPVIHVPTVQMNFRTPPEKLRTWRTRIDQLVSRRLDRKGIIHTVSFARAKEIIAHSEYSDYMLLNESKTTKWTVERFKSAAAPCILVSPSVTTGYDFPYEECEYQIIGKIPFPDNRAAVIKARMEFDKEYSNYITMQMLIQMCGRGMRSEDDQCENIIIDDNIEWFIRYNGMKFAPKWFRDSLVWAAASPQPLPKLVR